MGIADGKRALIVGVANDKSLAWSIAQELTRAGRRGRTYLSGRNTREAGASAGRTRSTRKWSANSTSATTSKSNASSPT